MDPTVTQASPLRPFRRPEQRGASTGAPHRRRPDTGAISESPGPAVIDGYVNLDPAGTPGLGAHLHAHTALPIIGVAKTAFGAAIHAIVIPPGTHRCTSPFF
jgi:deoxyribonuclease V